MTESEDTDIIPVPANIVPSPTNIVRSRTEITAANSTLAKPALPSESSLASVTYRKLDLDTILDGLIPNPLPESSGKDNAIHHLNITIFGKPNTGKCLTGDDVVPTTTGSIVRVGNIHPGLEVDRKELAWTAFVAKTGSGVFRVSRPFLSSKWLLRNVGPSEATEASTVEVVATEEVTAPDKKSAVELDEPRRRSAVEAKPAVRPKKLRNKWARGVSIAVMTIDVLAILFLAWTYVRPLLR